MLCHQLMLQKNRVINLVMPVAKFIPSIRMLSEPGAVGLEFDMMQLNQPNYTFPRSTPIRPLISKITDYQGAKANNDQKCCKQLMKHYMCLQTENKQTKMLEAISPVHLSLTVNRFTLF
jgi:hypothetical protein